MAKSGMKLGGVAIMMMIILAHAQAYNNLASSQVEPNSVWGKVKCGAKCALECAPSLETEVLYAACVAACLFKCRHAVVDVGYNCISSCDLAKSIDLDNGARGLMPYVLDSCLESCPNKN